MKDKTPLSLPLLRAFIEAGDTKSLQELCRREHPANIAEFLSDLLPAEAWQVLRNAPLPLRAEIFSHLDYELQVALMATVHRRDAADILADMPPDDRAGLFNRLPEESRERVLPALAQAEREDIRRLAGYREGTAGAVMTSDYATLAPGDTASQAIEHLREVAPDKETIYYAYVTDEQRKLLGFVSLKDLILAPRQVRVRDIMHRDVISARVDDDQEDTARKIQKYDLLALPVINGDDLLVGIITYDDAMDVLTQEHTEDMEKFMAISGSHEAAMYMKTSALVHFRNRVVWIVALAFLGLVSGFIVQNFERLLLQFAILAAFMPMLADTGGNTGSQSASLVIRALALKEITPRPRDVLRILSKEAVVALLLGILLSALTYGRVVLFGGGSTMPAGFSLHTIGVAIAAALGLQVFTATLIGALLPLAAARMKLDPAVVASPALTTVVDITGLMIFFTTAKMVLGF